MSNKNRSTSVGDRLRIRKRLDQGANIAEVCDIADAAAKHYFRASVTRREMQAAIDAAVGSPFAILGSWFRNGLRTITGARKRLERELAVERERLEAHDDEAVAAMNPANAQEEIEEAKPAGAHIVGDGYEPLPPLPRIGRRGNTASRLAD